MKNTTLLVLLALIVLQVVDNAKTKVRGKSKNKIKQKSKAKAKKMNNEE